MTLHNCTLILLIYCHFGLYEKSTSDNVNPVLITRDALQKTGNVPKKI